MQKPLQKIIDMDAFFKKHNSDRKLYRWLLSKRFKQDHDMLKAACLNDSNKLSMLDAMLSLRNSQLRSDNYLFWFRVSILIAIGVAIGLDIAFTGGVGTVITFAIANPTYAAIIAAGAVAALYVVPKILTQATNFFYKESEMKIFEHSLKLNENIRSSNIKNSIMDSAALFRNMQHGWFSDSKRNKTIGLLVGKVMKSFSTQQIVPISNISVVESNESPADVLTHFLTTLKNKRQLKTSSPESEQKPLFNKKI